jgi:hypothetical protein
MLCKWCRTINLDKSVDLHLNFNASSWHTCRMNLFNMTAGFCSGNVCYHSALPYRLVSSSVKIKCKNYDFNCCFVETSSLTLRKQNRLNVFVNRNPRRRIKKIPLWRIVSFIFLTKFIRMKETVFWDVSLCSLVEIDPSSFEKICRVLVGV